jgi:hypothetical protein
MKGLLKRDYLLSRSEHRSWKQSSRSGLERNRGTVGVSSPGFKSRTGSRTLATHTTQRTAKSTLTYELGTEFLALPVPSPLFLPAHPPPPTPLSSFVLCSSFHSLPLSSSLFLCPYIHAYIYIYIYIPPITLTHSLTLSLSLSLSHSRALAHIHHCLPFAHLHLALAFFSIYRGRSYSAQ